MVTHTRCQYKSLLSIRGDNFRPQQELLPLSASSVPSPVARSHMVETRGYISSMLQKRTAEEELVHSIQEENFHQC